MSVSTISSPARLENRVLIHHRGAPGPTLICVAALHGNEPAGVGALHRVAPRLAELAPQLKGEFVGLVGNRQALAEGKRYLEHDLNRCWLPESLQRLAESSGPLTAESLEQRELHSALDGVLAAASGDAFLLDLHTTSGPGPAFSVLDDTLANRRFALELPVPVVLGIEEELDGTLAAYLQTRGLITAGFECGQHEDPESARRGEAAIWIALEASGVLPRGVAPEVEEGKRYLATEDPGLPQVVETRYRHPISPGDNFRMTPGFVSFQPIRAGQAIASNGEQSVTATEDGRILMPLYQRQGDDGFFIVRDVKPFWLRLSGILRRLRAERMLHWLPGVRRKPGEELVFIIDRRIARWYALQILHLLGFRRHGTRGDRIEVSRRQGAHPQKRR